MTGDVRTVRAVDASMGLLNDVTSKALDPGYAEAAARPAVGRTTGDRAGRATLHLVLAVVLGVVTVVAVSDLRRPAQADGSPRVLLEREITERTSDVDDLTASIDTLSAEIAQIQADALESVNPGIFAQLDEYEVASGTRAVTGPGLLLVMDDGESTDPEDNEARIQDVDLQIVTNGLWAAGAEAIAINGQRLTSLSAIRAAGPAILVDLVPLLAPYHVEAIGDAQKMQTAFARSPAANHLAFLSGTYGVVVTTTAVDELGLPGSSSGTLRYTTLLEDVASSAPPEKSDPVQEKGSP